MRTLRRVGAGVLALTLFTGLSACGDDDDPEANDDGGEQAEANDDGGKEAEANDDGGEEAAADSAAFCDAVVEFNTAFFQSDIGDATPEDIVAQGEVLAPLSQTVADEAPEDLAGNAAELNESVQALTEGDAAGFSSDATFEQYTALVGGAIEECELDTIDVTGVDYAYEGVPETIDAGTTAFTFTNAAESEDHMMAIIRKKDGVELSWDELLALPGDEGQQMTDFRGETFAPAGETSNALSELDPGDYALLCFIPVGSPEAADGPPHFAEGMIQEFTVE